MLSLFITLISYPFGGGEDFLYQCMHWCTDKNIKVVWISFLDKFRQEHKKFLVRKTEHGYIVDLPGGFKESTLREWIKLIKPDFINTQGFEMTKIVKVAEEFAIPVICGFHFWIDLVDLNAASYNKDIIENIDKHKISPNFSIIKNSPIAFPYVCSEFVRDVVKKLDDIEMPVIYPSSGSEKIKLNMKPWFNQYILQINIHKLKGGEILEKIITANPDLPYICIQTEPCSEDLDNRIKNLLNSDSRLLGHTENMVEIYAQTRIMLAPSIVDETFCRTVCEAMANGIPIITTGKGNISNLVGDSAIILNENDDWGTAVVNLYTNPDLLKQYSERTKRRYKLFSENVAKAQFSNLFYQVNQKLSRNNIMIIAPFCDQGLGVQTKHYINTLTSHYNIHIFSFSPYYGYAIDRQKDPSEWAHESVYYTNHTREEITDEEILDFVRQKNIGKCIIPETCWFRVFEIAQLLKRKNIKCYAIPNIEIIRSDEIYKHEYYHLVLANNWLCYNKLKEYGLSNIKYLGFSIPNDIKPKTPGNVIKFCCIGGMNAFTRKHVLEVCKAFSIAKQQINNVLLIVTIQGNIDPRIEDYKNVKGITVIDTHLSHHDIMTIVKSSDILIQVSSQEGLGLGFFEAISVGTSVLTLDTPPHNEIINKGNGWLIPCMKGSMNDNNKSIIDASYFDENVLAEKIIEISHIPKSEFPHNFVDNFNSFKKNFLNLLN